MTDTLVSTDRLVEDARRAARQVKAGMGVAYRTALLDARNKLRARAQELEGRLTTADEMYEHTTPDPMPARYEAEWLRLESEYRTSHDAAHRATQAL